MKCLLDHVKKEKILWVRTHEKISQQTKWFSLVSVIFNLRTITLSEFLFRKVKSVQEMAVRTDSDGGGDARIAHLVQTPCVSKLFGSSFKFRQKKRAVRARGRWEG